MTNTVLDVAGIGIGPFNLSVAALLDGASDMTCQFFDHKPRFAWHPGMMLPDTLLQTSWMKDLVSPVQPTSPFSFMAYLVSHRRLYKFITANFSNVSRMEFNDYFGWVARQLESLQFSTKVNEIHFTGDAFEIHHDRGVAHARNLLLGSGQVPFTPAWAGQLPTKSWVHSSDFATRPRDFTGRHVAVIGGGQSGAEIVAYLLGQAPDRVGKVSWISRRSNFSALDEIAFSNEYFTPDYVQRFHLLPEARRSSHVTDQKLASDGASPTTLQYIYQRIYQLSHISGDADIVRMLPHRDVRGASRFNGRTALDLHNGFDDSHETSVVDQVIFATGYANRMPSYLAPMLDRLDLDASGRFRLDRAFRLAWDGPPGRSIFVQNAGRHTHGVAEPQLSLMAWRSASIINTLAGRSVFDLEDDAVMEWSSTRYEGGAVLGVGGVPSA